MRAFMQQVRPWAGPVLAYTLIAVVMLAMSAHPAWAEDIIAQAQGKVEKLIVVAGLVMILGAVVTGVKSGLKVADEGRGWGGIAVAFILFMMGIQVSGGVKGVQELMK